MTVYVEQEWDFAKVKAGAEFGLPHGIRCKVLDWDLQASVAPAMLLVKYRQHGVDHLMQVHMRSGVPKVGPRLVIFVPVEETVVRRTVNYSTAFGDDNVLCGLANSAATVGEVELTIHHVPGEPPRLTGARVV